MLMLNFLKQYSSSLSLGGKALLLKNESQDFPVTHFL
jgi:hypothetical protein